MNILKELKTKDYATLVGTFFGIFSIILSIDGTAYRAAGLFIFLSIVMDFVDGYIARKLNQINEFGKELDSLSDAICFGVAPAILVYRAYSGSAIYLGIQGLPIYILLIPCSLFILAAITRLAWFNVDEGEGYAGLQTPISAGFIVLLTFIDYFGYEIPQLGISFSKVMKFVIPISMLILAYFNVSPYLVYGKDVRKKRGVIKYIFLLTGILIFAAFILTLFHWSITLLIAFTIILFLLGLGLYYIIYGIINYVRTSGTTST